ncbi:MAG: M14 family metallopeptidase [Bryobacteraceae bacterium]|nr:M14 family metallopeptidase [Bryobacteraceae bacterium]MDW8378437.1 M14 family metallopeptidase [Bryobacterales bacterium]
MRLELGILLCLAAGLGAQPRPAVPSRPAAPPAPPAEAKPQGSTPVTTAAGSAAVGSPTPKPAAAPKPDAGVGPGQLPEPSRYFGHAMGEDRKLLDWDRVVSYFQALAKASPKIRVVEFGRSVQGRPLIAAFLSSEANLKDLSRFNVIQKRLADSRTTPEAEAEKLIAEGKAVVMITCSIHATEVVSTSTAVEFAWRLLTDGKNSKFKQILENVIFILVPSLNPDGVDIVTQWYRKTLGTRFEGTSPPELYHVYVGHDNNRDWYIFSQPETRATVQRLHNAWHPHIVYDVHQQGANASRMFVPPWMDPIDPNVDPAIAQMANLFGMGIAADLTAAGKTGVVVNAIYDFWTPARHYQSYHGGLRILSESASARLASPVTIRPEQIPATGPGYSPRERSWNHLEPWLGGEWRVRDILEYQLIAFESLLWQAAVRREDLLRNFYRVLKRAAEREKPYAFVIPKEQLDPGSAKRLLETLAFGLVEVDQAKEAFQAGGKTYAAGCYVVRLQQPFSAFAKTLLERQQYPDLRLYPGGPPKRPYDVTAHTLPLLMGVEVDTVSERFQAVLAPVKSFAFTLKGQAPEGALPASDVDSWRVVNQAWATGRPVARDSSGHFYLNRAATGDLKPLRRPRIALYRSYIPSMDEGWTRWLLDAFGFSYARLTNPEVLAGQLRRRFDVIVFPDQSAATIHNGYAKGSMPDEYVGGLGETGAQALRQFAEQGGKIIFLNDSTEYAVKHLALPVKNSVGGVSSRDFYSPGSLLWVTLELKHPLTRGLPEQIAIWSEGSPAWEIPTAANIRSLAQYPPSQILASGWLLGEKFLAGRSALLEVSLGSGRVYLFGMRPQYRAQSWQTFKLLFNALVSE